MTLYTPLWAQNATYPARADRHLIRAVLGADERVLSGLRVTPRGAGANMTVDIEAGEVAMPGPDGPYVGYSDSIENRAIGAAPASGLTRRDLVVAVVTDPQAMGSGAEIKWDIEVVPGVASSTPALPTQPAWSTVLAEVTVPSTSVSVDDNDITDMRVLHHAVPAGIEFTSEAAISNTATAYINFAYQATHPASLDEGLFWSTSDRSRLTIPWTGFWAWSGTMRISSTGGFGYTMWVLVDGSGGGSLDGFEFETGIARGFGKSGVYLTAGTRLRVRISNAAGGPRTFRLNSPDELFRLTYLGPEGRV